MQMQRIFELTVRQVMFFVADIWRQY